VHVNGSWRAARRKAVLRSAVTHRSRAPRSVATANQIATSAAAMNTGPQIPPPGRSNSSRNAASMVHSPALNARSRNLENPLNAALASQRSSSSRPVAGLSDDEDDRGGKQDPLKILTRCGLPSHGGRLRRRQPREAVRRRREAEQAPARSVVVRYLHRATRTMPLKQSRSAGKGLERLCRARSRARSGAPTGRRRRVVPVVVCQRGLPEASPRHVRRRRERLGRSGLGLPRLGARRRWSPSSWRVVNPRCGRHAVWPCFGREREPTSPKKTQSQRLRRRAK
jgi:hypothetical protein